MARAPGNSRAVVPWPLVAVVFAVGVVYIGVPVGLELVFGLPTSAAGRALVVILIGTLVSLAALVASRLTRKAGAETARIARVLQRAPAGHLGPRYNLQRLADDARPSAPATVAVDERGQQNNQGRGRSLDRGALPHPGSGSSR